MADLAQILHALQQPQQDNTALHQANNELHQTMTSMQNTTQTSLAPNTSQGHPQAPKVTLPDKFDGTRAKYQGFVNQLRLIFWLQPDRYPDGLTQVGLF